MQDSVKITDRQTHTNQSREHQSVTYNDRQEDTDRDRYSERQFKTRMKSNDETANDVQQVLDQDSYEGRGMGRDKSMNDLGCI